MKDHVLGNGIYGYGEASRLTELHPNRVRAWFSGRGGGKNRLMESDYARAGVAPTLISFLDLIELLVVGRLRGLGLTLQYLRKARRHMAGLLETVHPFSHQRMMTDGQKLFLEFGKTTEDLDLVEVVSLQYEIPDVLLPYLTQVEYDQNTSLARRWHIFRSVVLDPEIEFGKPTLAGTRLLTSTLSAEFYANGKDATRVADWRGIESDKVLAAVEFEKRFGWLAA